ncbi:MAG: oligogalacturonate lyase family protein [Candidatus Omnitrophica bacterium]|nr:oligogalacturonate lyase family protein [Candidatus Omnitrophota bacterium]MCM8802595.1 oligogalacturonate lyase family protein [Candidatus Omnitrophota bacterium]
MGVIEGKKKIFYDRKTGREIWEIGIEGSDCVPTYMYFQSFSQDERYIIFASNRTGKFELYRMEIETNQIIQITKDFGNCYNFTCFNEEVIFNDGETITGINVETLEKRIIIEKEEEWLSIFGGPAISEKNKKIACFFKDINENIGIVYTDIENPEIKRIYRFPLWIKEVSHLIASPSDEFILTFNILPDKQDNFQLPPTERARAWKIDIEKEKLEPFLIMPKGFRATHEYWGHNDNLRLYFHKKTVPNFTPVFISSIDISGSDYKEHFYSETRKLGHSSISYDNKFIVSDVQEKGENEFYLISLETGNSEIICWPNSSCSSERNQLGHVHPSFSPSGKFIVFSSDFNGKTSVYIIPLNLNF